MPEVTARQRLFMCAVLGASKRQNSVFSLSELCVGLKMTTDECGEIVRWAEKAGLLNNLRNDQAILTAAGRALAERLAPPPG